MVDATKNTQGPEKARLVYPYLVMLYPILTLASQHHQHVFWRDVFIACGMVVAVLFVSALCLRVPLRDPHKRAIVVLFVALVFWGWFQ